MSIICILCAVLLISFQMQTLSQVLPTYSGVPISYNNNEDDDLGLLLAILMLAGRNRDGGCGCCNCCNSRGPQNIPIPFPIPFPTNNPIVNRRSDNRRFQNVDDDEDKPRVKLDKGGGNNIYVDITEQADD